MEPVAWLVLGAVAGYAAGGVAGGDDGLGGLRETVIGCIAGLAGGFASAWLGGFRDPINGLDPQTLVWAVVLAAVAVVVLSALADSRGFDL